MSLQSALIGFLLSRFLPTPMTPQENIVVQTTAVATGTMPLAAGFVGILPALSMLDEERDGVAPIYLSWLGAVGWSCAVAYFGSVALLFQLYHTITIMQCLSLPSHSKAGRTLSSSPRIGER